MSSRRRQSLSPTLFPFLAVLVCTLGTLILLLALVAQKASDDARRIAEAPAESEPEIPELELNFQPIDESGPLTVGQVEDMILEEEFRLEELVSHRDAQTADLEDRRDRLAHVEDHMRRIRIKLKQISDAMERAASDDTLDVASEEEIQQLKQKLVSAEKVVKRLRQDVQSKRPRVVIVPHQGPNGTSRRPIYIECTPQGVTIWPENVSITKAQLENSDRDANPLDAALRAVRYHVTQTYGSKTPPYPMLIVRPGGVDSYYAARGAMTDWDDQFGYELVPTQVELAYQTPDANLKERVDYAVKQAIELQTRQSIAGAFRGGGGSGSNRYGGRTRGTGQNLAGATEQGRGDSGTEPRPRKSFPRLSVSQMDRQGRQSGFSDHRTLPVNTYGNNYGGTSGIDSSLSMDDAKRRLERQIENSAESLANVDRSDGLDSLAENSLADQSTKATRQLGSEAGDFASGTGMQRDASYQGNPYQGKTPSGPTPNLQNDRDSMLAADASLGGQPFELNQPNNGSASSRGSNFEMATNDAGTNGSAAGTSSAPTTQFSQSSGGGSSTRGGSEPPPNQTAASQRQQSSGTGSPSQSQPGQKAPPQLTRNGVDWALPRSVSLARGNDIVRPIRVRVYGDQIVLLPGVHDRTSSRGSQSFPFAGGDINTATLQMAAAVKERVSNWGAALPGGRWSPRLQVQVMPGAQRRAGQLQQLMAGSGLELQFAPAMQPATRQAITLPETRR